MNNTTAFDIMMQRLGNRRESDLRALVVQELNRKIEEEERSEFIPWFLEDTAYLPTVANQDYIDLPDDFLREAEEGKVWVYDDSWLQVDKVYMQDLEEMYTNLDPGVPVHYAIYGEKFFFGPTPDAIYQVKFPYAVQSGEVSDDSSDTTGWLKYAFNYISSATLKVVAANELQDVQMAAVFSGQANEARQKLFKYHESRQHINADYHIGGMN